MNIKIALGLIVGFLTTSVMHALNCLQLQGRCYFCYASRLDLFSQKLLNDTIIITDLILKYCNKQQGCACPKGDEIAHIKAGLQHVLCFYGKFDRD